MRIDLKVGFLGAGNMNQAIMIAMIESKTLNPEQIYVSNRTPGKLEKIKSLYNVTTVSTNEELADVCDVIFIGVKPSELQEALEPISSAFHEDTVLISLAAGVELTRLQKFVPHTKNWVRLMANTAVSVQKSVNAYCLSPSAKAIEPMIKNLIEPLGLLVEVDDGDDFSAFTVACSSGVGFVIELMIYWQEWLEEHGFSPDKARQMAVQTFVGASQIAEKSSSISLNDLQQKVVSKKGMTAVGLDSMRELETERTLRYSFEKTALKEKQFRDQF